MEYFLSEEEMESCIRDTVNDLYGEKKEMEEEIKPA